MAGHVGEVGFGVSDGLVEAGEVPHEAGEVGQRFGLECIHVPWDIEVESVRLDLLERGEMRIFLHVRAILYRGEDPACVLGA